MGECCAGSRCEPADSDTCRKIGGDYYPNGRPKCALGSLLREYLDERGDPLALLAAGGTYAALYDVSDVVLPRSERGQQVLRFYEEFAPKMVPILRADEALFQDFYRVYLAGMLYVRQLVRVHAGLPPMEIRFTEEMQHDLRSILRRFRKAAAVQTGSAVEFEEPFKFLEALTDQFVGLTPSQIYEGLTSGRQAECS